MGLLRPTVVFGKVAISATIAFFSSPPFLHRSYIIVQISKCKIPERVLLTEAICKRFSTSFRFDISQQNWDSVSNYEDPNDMWKAWKSLFFQCVDKHAPLRSKRVRAMKSPSVGSHLIWKTECMPVTYLSSKPSVRTRNVAMLLIMK